MKVYLDNCCFNRPFDDQSQLRIRLESEAKLAIQEGIRSGTLVLVWSYVMDYENIKNPFPERRDHISKWRSYAMEDIKEDESLLASANFIGQTGIQKMDSLHIACAVKANVDYFLTTDDLILKRASLFAGIKIIDPIGFIKEVSL